MVMYEAEAKTKQTRGCSGSRPIQKAGSVGKWSVLLLCTSALLSGCLYSGGSSSSSYEVSTTTGTGGSIDPNSETVSSEETAEFTVEPDEGYEIDSVTGCDGSLSGSTYTTGAITQSCEVSATFTATSKNSTVVVPDRYEIIGTDGGVQGGIVKDVETDLQWMRCSLGQTWDGSTCDGSASTYNFDGAQDAANDLNEDGGYGGHTDWRVPDKDELRTLVYCSSGDPEYFNESGSSCNGSYDSPTIFTEVFPNTRSPLFWSASPYAGHSGYAWRVYFNDGHHLWSLKSLNGRVRLVRGGQ